MQQNLTGKMPLSVGLLAHVDAGKTTLSEALLYCSGTRRTLGRVDHRDAFLDTHTLERSRGITIFSKLALLSTETRDITLLDTPGHADFAAEAERVMPVLDCAVLVISGTDGIQSHTLTLWNLLERYQVPVFLFINKMDLPGKDKEALLAQLQQQLGHGCLDFAVDGEQLAESAAMCDEALLETYLESGIVTDANIRGLVEARKIFPCCFGSGLKLEGVDKLLELLDRYAPQPHYPDAFGARVYKISRDPQGNRLTWLKITGGSLSVRESVSYSDRKGEQVEEKIVQLRRYSGEKFTMQDTVSAGTVCAVTGLSRTWVGQGLGMEEKSLQAVMEPVMTYRLTLPASVAPISALPKLRQLEEEDPQLHLIWDDRLKQIHVQIMGKIQLEVLRSLVRERFGWEITLDDQRIYYKETIAAPVEGIGHYEPLRHYAEVHLLMEPLPLGSGLVFDSVCPTDVLDAPFQNLVLTHLAEKSHLGVLTGSPITDMKLTLVVGKAHIKHTEGGDFRQATYRAVRQGLMQAQSVLLEPWYAFTLQVPTEQVGRAITDIRAMSGTFEGPDSVGSLSVLTGKIPASELGDYADQLAGYTQGRGQLQVRLDSYAPCHNSQAVIDSIGYDPESDLDNTPDSVFCAHGGGFTVKWRDVSNYMHLESILETEKPALITRNLRMDEKELEAIMEREFGPVKRPLYRPPVNRPAEEKLVIRPLRQQCILVDGYNIIFSWDSLSAVAKEDLDAARRALLDRLSSYAGYKKHRIIVVFDGYKQKGNPGEKSTFHNIQVVYTKEGETADAYIEALAVQIGSNYAVKVATSDSLVQLSSLRSGILRMSARELEEEVLRNEADMRQHYRK